MMRVEYPRPQFRRESFLILNGEWSFAFDDENSGLEESWYEHSKAFHQTIQVPFVYQASLSGIDDRSVHDIVWYQKGFDWEKRKNKKTLLHFGAVDYQADVYVNDRYVGQHIGGHTSFSFDITNFLVDGQQSITVRAWDPHDDETIPRGKQFWEAESRGIWYTNSTGIWQTVWLEEVDTRHIEKVAFTPNLDEGSVLLSVTVPKQALGSVLRYKISFKDTVIVEDQTTLLSPCTKRSVDIYNHKIFRTNFHDHGWTWSPEHPNLFDVSLELLVDGEVTDCVESYFGMRKIHVENGMIFLNNQPYYQKLILDQGYWPEGLLTAPSDAAFIKDIQLAKEMGFNGCRKHQKVEDPRYLYWADKLGFIVWGECASAPVYTSDAAARLTQEWVEIIERDYNHPSIVTWVPLNESWGIPDIHLNTQQQSFSRSIYHYLHALDTTRLVISNDGWEMTETDICAIHNYSHGEKEEVKKYRYFKDSLADVEGLIQHPPGKWATFAKGFAYQNQPILLTEFGGIGYEIGGQTGWGYTSAGNEAEFLDDYGRIMDAIYSSRALWGYCYTQLADVEQEINGLLTYDRQPKVSLEAIKEINDQYHPERIFIGNQQK
ncbi:glycoside hydrolase family 2 protein [Enterococcus sp. BWR-S5]|uniref:glycoside hydrolase family 2 protein n=1 Tax=Enterococcus sp. BWR-S5 TaxID=2787714 RepID=UPI0019236BD2|nr:sugar-binding domain-containing protein [Enterococcus sp. BWR-S5]MBL1226573.1 glycoside hydrolase family 2 [Enterococcus sp. BWR-S5]